MLFRLQFVEDLELGLAVEVGVRGKIGVGVEKKRRERAGRTFMERERRLARQAWE